MAKKKTAAKKKVAAKKTAAAAPAKKKVAAKKSAAKAAPAPAKKAAAARKPATGRASDLRERLLACFDPSLSDAEVFARVAQTLYDIPGFSALNFYASTPAKNEFRLSGVASGDVSEGVLFYDADEDVDSRPVLAVQKLPDEASILDEGAALPAYLMRDGRPVSTNDLSEEDAAFFAEEFEEDVRNAGISWLYVPLAGVDSPAGALAVALIHPRPRYIASDLEVARGFASALRAPALRQAAHWRDLEIKSNAARVKAAESAVKSGEQKLEEHTAAAAKELERRLAGAAATHEKETGELEVRLHAEAEQKIKSALEEVRGEQERAAEAQQKIIQEREARIAVLEEQSGDLYSIRKELEAERDGIREKLEAAEKDREQLRTELTNARQALGSAEELTEKIRGLESTLEKLREDHEAELELLREDKEAQLQKEKQERETQLAQLRSEHEERLEKTREASAGEVSRDTPINSNGPAKSTKKNVAPSKAASSRCRRRSVNSKRI